MYTVILMAALSSGQAATGHWFHHAGCSGCQGWSHAGYSGNSYCHGCQGCAGWSCYGNPYGYGGNYSVYAPPSCLGVFGCTGCYGCYGGWSCYGVALPNHGYWNECPPGGVSERTKDNLKIEETPAPKELKGKEQTRARVILDAPAQAKIYVDGQLIKAAQGSFLTPELVAGQKYFYDLRVEIVRDGQTTAENRQVILQAGQTVTAAFPDLSRGEAVSTGTER